MNLSEFKAWFEGYTENMDGPPNAKQWKRIKERVGEIVEFATPYPVFIDRYVRPYYPWWIYTTCGTTTTLSNSGCASGSSVTYAFNSSDAFRELGRLEAAE